jgi:hypothetical protein
MRDDDPTVSFQRVTCKKATEKALLCDIDGQDFWIPVSQVHPDSEVYDEDHEGTLVVSEWIAKQKGLI